MLERLVVAELTAVKGGKTDGAGFPLVDGLRSPFVDVEGPCPVLEPSNEDIELGCDEYWLMATDAGGGRVGSVLRGDAIIHVGQFSGRYE